MSDRITIVGPGRLGRSLHVLLSQSGDAPTVVRDAAPPPDTEVIVLTVPDAAVQAVASRIPRGPIVLHCSGALGVDVLRPHARAGSMHPLMTFPGPEVAMPSLAGVPAAIAGDPEALEAAARLARRLGMEPLHVPGDRRLYHAAAVLSGNLATVLLADAGRALEAAGVPPEAARNALLPLALESLRNAARDPARALTGPVARGDRVTLDAHRAALREARLDDLLSWIDLLERQAQALLARSAPGS